MKMLAFLALAALAICLLAGCGGSAIPGDISDATVLPTDSTATATPPNPTANDGTGSVRFSIGQLIRALADRIVFDDVLVQCRLASDNSVLREAILTQQNPTAIFAGLPGGTVCYIYAEARRGGTPFTSGRSVNITIVAGSNANASVVLDPTIPTFGNQLPASSPPVTSSSATISLSVTDPGGKVPTSTITVDGTAYGPFTSGTPSVSLTGLADGTHTVAVSSTTPSGGSNSTSWSFTVSTVVPPPTVRPEFLGWVGKVVTLSGGSQMGYDSAIVTVVTPPNATEAVVDVFLTTAPSSSLQLTGRLDLTTAQFVGGWTAVKLNGSTVANPGGSTGLWQYDSNTGHLDVANVTAYADGVSASGAFDVSVSAVQDY